MALIKCRECGRDISDKAASCPACGAPVDGAHQVTVTARAGGKWEGWGFVMIAIGLISMLAGTAWGMALFLAGFAVFLVGRFK